MSQDGYVFRHYRRGNIKLVTGSRATVCFLIATFRASLSISLRAHELYILGLGVPESGINRPLSG